MSNAAEKNSQSTVNCPKLQTDLNFSLFCFFFLNYCTTKCSLSYAQQKNYFYEAGHLWITRFSTPRMLYANFFRFYWSKAQWLDKALLAINGSSVPFEIFANNTKLTMLTYLTHLSTVCFNLGDYQFCTSFHLIINQYVQEFFNILG